MQTIKAVHETDGNVVIFDSVYDADDKKVKLIYYKVDGTVEEATKGKFTITEKHI